MPSIHFTILFDHRLRHTILHEVKHFYKSIVSNSTLRLDLCGVSFITNITYSHYPLSMHISIRINYSIINFYLWKITKLHYLTDEWNQPYTSRNLTYHMRQFHMTVRIDHAWNNHSSVYLKFCRIMIIFLRYIYNFPIITYDHNTIFNRRSIHSVNIICGYFSHRFILISFNNHKIALRLFCLIYPYELFEYTFSQTESYDTKTMVYLQLLDDDSIFNPRLKPCTLRWKMQSIFCYIFKLLLRYSVETKSNSSMILQR